LVAEDLVQTRHRIVKRRADPLTVLPELRNEPGTSTHDPFENSLWPARDVGVMEAAWMQQWKARQQLCVDAVVFDVLVVIAAQIRGLLRWHEVHGRSFDRKERTRRDPHRRRWFHHHDELVVLAHAFGRSLE
jgi:hypothetical protein